MSLTEAGLHLISFWACLIIVQNTIARLVNLYEYEHVHGFSWRENLVKKEEKFQLKRMMI